MTPLALIGCIVFGIVTAYIPWEERIVRAMSALAAAGVCITALILAWDAWMAPLRTGWGNVWNLDAATTLALIILVPTAGVAYAMAERVFSREHLEGSLSFLGLRSLFAALHVVVGGAALLALTAHWSFVLGGAAFFVLLTATTVRWHASPLSRPFALIRDGMWVSILSLAALRIVVTLSPGAQQHVALACLIAGILGVAVVIALRGKGKVGVEQSAIIVAMAMSVFSLGIGAAGIIATAMLWLALSVTAILVHVGTHIHWGKEYVQYLAVGLPPSAFAIPYFIIFGYGLQLHPWVTGGIVALFGVFLLVSQRGMRVDVGAEWRRDRLHIGLVITGAVQVLLAIGFALPQVMLRIIAAVGPITGSAM